ncbi:MAG: ammonium transporter [Thermoleophilia bacterium]|nr:ammonium transporter [Thermoleophilia bacterium]
MNAVAIDTVWVIAAGCLVLLMQAGFAALEMGLSRMKNAGAVAAKIIINFSPWPSWCAGPSDTP